MDEARIKELREASTTANWYWHREELVECLDEIERLQAENEELRYEIRDIGERHEMEMREQDELNYMLRDEGES